MSDWKNCSARSDAAGETLLSSRHPLHRVDLSMILERFSDHALHVSASPLALNDPKGAVGRVVAGGVISVIPGCCCERTDARPRVIHVVIPVAVVAVVIAGSGNYPDAIAARDVA